MDDIFRSERQLYIGGKWQEGRGARRTIVNPADESELLEVREASPEQVDEAVRAAHDAFHRGEWSLSSQMRSEKLRELARKVKESSARLARLETLNTGKTCREALLDVHDAADCLTYYADLIERQSPRRFPQENGTVSEIRKEPVGVCALIVPWNFPLLLGVWKLAPALAAGNTVVFKPSEHTPLSMLYFTALLEQSGIPPGVFNLVPGDGMVGERIVAHEQVAKVSFTGGTETGRHIYELCARKFKKVSLELGGKSPLRAERSAGISITG